MLSILIPSLPISCHNAFTLIHFHPTLSSPNPSISFKLLSLFSSHHFHPIILSYPIHSHPFHLISFYLIPPYIAFHSISSHSFSSHPFISSHSVSSYTNQNIQLFNFKNIMWLCVVYSVLLILVVVNFISLCNILWQTYKQ